MVEVVVPWRGGCPHRDRAWAWIRPHLERPGRTVTLAPAPDGPWSKAAAVTPAIAASRANTIVVADADIWTPGLEQAIDAVDRGAPWAIPHTTVLRLTEHATAEVLDGTRTLAPGVPLEERPYRGVVGGGCVVLRRDVALDVPLDPRFTGWGQEDTSWGIALHHLAGPAVQSTGWLFHLWHPPQERLDRRYGSVEGRALYRRYRAARSSPDALRQIIEEAKTCSPTS